jgi:hypothetical protein
MADLAESAKRSDADLQVAELVARAVCSECEPPLNADAHLWSNPPIDFTRGADPCPG